MAEHATLASLTRRLNVRLSLVIGGVSLLVTVLFAGYLAVKENRAQEALAGTTFDYLTKALENPAWDLDTDSIREIGSAFCQDNRISRLVVSGNRGEQLFSFARDGTDAAITRNGEIRHNGEVIGAAYLSFSNVSARESQKNLVYFVIWINVIIVLALGLGTGAIVRRQLRVPLEWLKRVVDEYANRAVSLTRVEPPFIEFGPFRDVLFEMAGRSRSQLDDLQGLNQALGESETRFRTLLEHAPIAISVSRDATGLYCNRKFLDMFGLRSVEEAVGRPIVEYFAPQYREASLERSRRRANGLPLPLEFESVALRSDGVQFPIHAAVAEVQLSDGPANIAFITDITGRKRLEDQLRQSQKMQAIGQLAGGVAHDFNNILAATMMTLDLAAENPNLDREAREALKELDDQAKRAASLTRQLLMFSRR